MIHEQNEVIFLKMDETKKAKQFYRTYLVPTIIKYMSQQCAYG